MWTSGDVLQAGGNAIAFAKTCGFVLACEIEEARVETAKENAGVYGMFGYVFTWLLF